MKSEIEKMNLGERLDYGIRLARKRMLQEKALHNQDVVVGDGKGGVISIPAKDIVDKYVTSDLQSL